MKHFLLLFLFLCVFSSCQNKANNNNTSEDYSITVSPDAIQPIAQDSIAYFDDFPSEYVDQRNVEVWLPKGYPQPNLDYKVLYIHDGQNVLNAKTSYTGIAWEVDEKLDSLLQKNAVEPTIVVAIWNNGKKRFNEYMPKFPAEVTESAFAKAELKQYSGFDRLYSDEYLKFLTQELRPFINDNFQVSEKAADTAIMGASMGAHISLYAMMKYPDIFGRAGCFSTHWPIPELGAPFMEALPAAIPSAETHKIYFDHGTKTLDKVYEPYQLEVNQMFARKGYDSTRLMYRKFVGHEHSEKYWKQRVQHALVFLLQ
ncbi:alpha/beta hydrolase [Nonlabens xiamenensis]|uniref:alpha/beta hydrolase n=1 Tax=Nonlabens xiamenensis TaxID=2341043 RepID=UPI000F60DD96|nr:alpha/beta hydrolase-fold protein [Nonlabens xiamenensis]